ncbi:hypothetical protein SAMN05216436_10714 [bacterium A37T11]|nr:hypothetical protein SAMN05216436_10714 [bacterium A37T11]
MVAKPLGNAGAVRNKIKEKSLALADTLYSGDEIVNHAWIVFIQRALTAAGGSHLSQFGCRSHQYTVVFDAVGGCQCGFSVVDDQVDSGLFSCCQQLGCGCR